MSSDGFMFVVVDSLNDSPVVIIGFFVYVEKQSSEFSTNALIKTIKKQLESK